MQNPSSHHTPTPPPHRVLIVEDDPDVCGVVARILETRGHEVRTAASGSEGLEVALAFRPHVTVVDIRLPGMSGIELARSLRSAADCKIIAMSCYHREDVDPGPGRELFDAYMVKPADVDAILSLCDA